MIEYSQMCHHLDRTITRNNDNFYGCNDIGTINFKNNTNKHHNNNTPTTSYLCKDYEKNLNRPIGNELKATIKETFRISPYNNNNNNNNRTTGDYYCAKAKQTIYR